MNLVEIVVRTVNDTSKGLESAKASFSKAGQDMAASLKPIGIAMAAAGGLSMAAPLGAAGLAMGAFGAIAYPVLKNTFTAVTANTAAQKTYNDSIARAKQAYEQQMAAATTAAQRHAANATLMKAEASATLTLQQNTTKLSAGQQNLVTNVDLLKKSFDGVEKALTPLIVGFAGMGSKILLGLMPAFEGLARAGGAALEGMLKPLSKLLDATAFSQFLAQMGTAAKQAAPLIGGLLVGALKVLMQLFEQLMPIGLQLLKTLAPVLLSMFSSAIPVIRYLAVAFEAVLKVITPYAGVLVPLAAGIYLGVKAFTAISAAVKIATAVWKVLQMTLLSNPWIAIATALVVIALLIIEYHNQIWAVITKVWGNVKKFIEQTWNDIMSFAKQWWPLLLGPAGLIVKYHNDIWQFIQKIWNDILRFLESVWNDIRNAASTAWHAIENTAASAWSTVYNGVKTGWNKIISWFRGIPHDLVAALSGLGDQLNSFAKNAMNLFLEGAKSVLGTVEKFFKGIPGDILSWLGIKSPPDWAIKAGEHIMNGLGIGMTNAHNKVAAATKKAVGSAVHSVGSGTARWAGIVQQALGMEGLSRGLTNQVLYQMQTESGGNPNAINLTDINAQMGDPSRGLLQVIGATFAAFHWPGTSYNIYDPLANVAAAINYARHVYGPNLMSQGSGLGSGHGYAAGGATAGGWGIVGERGRELIRLPGGASVVPHGQTEAMIGAGGGSQNLQIDLVVSGSANNGVVTLIRELVRTGQLKLKDSTGKWVTV